MKLHVRNIGEGYPVVLLHGLFGMSDNLQTFAKMLAEDNYAVHLADLRNHGHSPHSDEMTYELMAQDVAAVIKEHQLQKPILIGHSMGGKVVLKLISDFPDMAKAAVIIDIAPYQYPVHHREILDALQSVDVDSIQSRSEAEEKLSRLIQDTATKQFLLKSLHRTHEGKYEWRFNLEVLDREIESVGEQVWPDSTIDLPVLFVKGSESRYIDMAKWSDIQQRYTNAEIATIDNAGHWIHATHASELMKTVGDFLQKIPD